MRCAGAAMMAISITLAPGCTESRQVVGYHRPAPSRPRQVQPPPPGTRADAVVVNVRAAALDTDGNGYADLIQATAYLFDTRYAPPIREDGTFVFLLYAAGESAAPVEAQRKPMRQWRFAEEALAAARARTYFGPGYVFRLSLLEEGTDAAWGRDGGPGLPLRARRRARPGPRARRGHDPAGPPQRGRTCA